MIVPQLSTMEKSLATSEKEADSAEKKLELMEGVIKKLKAGAEDLYVEAKVGSTPVLSLLGDMKKVARKFYQFRLIILMILESGTGCLFIVTMWSLREGILCPI